MIKDDSIVKIKNEKFMRSNNFSQFHIKFTGFEKEVQQQLEFSIAENAGLLKITEINNENVDAGLTIHIHCFNCINDLETIKPEKFKPANERIVCAGNFNDFENVLLCVQTGCCGCISISNIQAEIIQAIICALQNKIYISPALASTIHKYFSRTTYYTDLFTHQEHELVKLLTTGALYKEIAWKMRISENTVRSHVRNIYSKMKVHSKTELTQKVLNFKLIPSLIYFFSEYVACLCY